MSTSTSSTAVATGTVVERLVQSGITESRARTHLANGWVRIDGNVVTDPASPIEPHAHVDIRTSWPRTR